MGLILGVKMPFKDIFDEGSKEISAAITDEHPTSAYSGIKASYSIL